MRIISQIKIEYKLFWLYFIILYKRWPLSYKNLLFSTDKAVRNWNVIVTTRQQQVIEADFEHVLNKCFMYYFYFLVKMYEKATYG